ncbi:MAG TPA: ATP-binding protein [Candidatus Binatia bacterium]|nr:ATP-binding protein [Candidatus Binatia bacterium]
MLPALHSAMMLARARALIRHLAESAARSPGRRRRTGPSGDSSASTARRPEHRRRPVSLPSPCPRVLVTLPLTPGPRCEHRVICLVFPDMATPVEVYEVLGARAIRTRLQAAAISRGLSRFVGRAPEMEELQRAVARAGDGHGQLVALVGDPGVGKSRLVHELGSSQRISEWLTVGSGAVSHERVPRGGPPPHPALCRHISDSAH